MNDRRPTELELAAGLSAYLPAAAPVGLSDSIHQAIGTVAQQRPLWSWAPPRRARGLSPVGWAAILALLLLGVLASVLLIGSLRRDEPPTHVLVLANDLGLRTIDLDSGATTSVLRDAGLSQVVPSPDGKLASFWTHHIGVDWLEVIGTDGRGRHRLAAELDTRNGGCIDRWAPDSSRLATTAVDQATRRTRILVVGLVDGSAEYISPKKEEAYCPRWSPDGTWIAFVSGTGGVRSVDVARPDGSELRTVSWVLGGERASGQLTWSPDGRFLYFDAENGEHAGRGVIYRVDMNPGGTKAAPVELATGDAPELSPDGSLLAFDAEDVDGIVNVLVAPPDGSRPRLLLRNALLAGWVPDGSMLLAESHDLADGPNGGLVAIRPDGSGRRLVIAFDRPCPVYLCLRHLGWGKPRWVDPFKPS